MNRLLRGVVYVFAAIGVFYVVMLSSLFWATQCKIEHVSYALSPDEKLIARFTQKICEDGGRSFSQVLVGSPGGDDWDLVLEAPPTSTQIGLTWLNGAELQITVPNNIAADTRNRVEDNYRVSFRRVPASDLKQ